MSYFAPTVSPDGRTLFALGRPPSAGGQLVRYDAASGLFVPFLGDLSARGVEFSRDGRWIAYVRHPDGTLWCSRPEGTDRRQLAFPPQTAVLPRWSPDGQKIAYASKGPGERWSSHVIAPDGGKAQPVTGEPGDLDPSWSPDGTRMVLGREGTGPSPPHLIVVEWANVGTGKVSALPGSEGLFSPRWSPDGRSIAALSADLKRLVLHDLGTGRWRELLAADLLGYPNWTRDSSRIQLWKAGAIVRVRAADGGVEPVTSLEGIPLVVTAEGVWIGIAPDDSPLLLRELSGPVEVYALDVEWP
jgi:Tol biopolymer transport system component